MPLPPYLRSFPILAGARRASGPVAAAVGKRDQAKLREAAEDSAGVHLGLDDGRP